MASPSINLVATLDGTIVGTLFADAAGDIYGEAQYYQTLGNVVFAVAAGTGAITTTGSFSYADGASFTGGLSADSNGNLYGTTQYGGTNADYAGTVFEIDPATLALTTLASASSTLSPGSPPIVDVAGDILYAHLGSDSAIEELIPGSDTLTTFLSTDIHSGLITDAAGNLFGAEGIGADGRGGIFEIAAGTTTVTDIVAFDFTNGKGLSGNLVMDAAGNIYGNAGNLFEIDASTHSYTVLANFTDGGASETNQIAVDAAGDILGTTTTGTGIVYELKVGSSTITTLLDDANGIGGLITGSDGNFYGANSDAIEEIALCYCPGTLIATDQGERPVESLRIGERVMTLGGVSQSIRWIGRRSYAGSFIAGRHLLLPIRIRADALGPSMPSRDLIVSPGHGLFIEGHLIPAWRLVNGVSITQADAIDRVTYLHIELGQHDILIANGVPAESFLDEDCRNLFHNAAEFHALYPASGHSRACAPRLEDGFQLDLIQRRIAARVGIRSRHSVRPGPLLGHIDIIDPEKLCGWAQDARHREEPVTLLIQVDGQTIQTILANGYRADLRQADLGSGCHAFAAFLPPGLEGVIELRRAEDGALLQGGARVRSDLAA